MSAHSFALSVEMPDDEPRQIVCTGEEAGADMWQPAFGVWEADDFGLASEEGVGDGERLYVSRRIYDALNARLASAEAMAEVATKLATWDHCWPGNINLEHEIGKLRAALEKWREEK